MRRFARFVSGKSARRRERQLPVGASERNGKEEDEAFGLSNVSGRKSEADRDLAVLLTSANPETVASPPCKGEIVPARIFDVHDGDTVKVLICHGGASFKIGVRIFGVDAPELLVKSKAKMTSNERDLALLEERAGALVRDHVKPMLWERILPLKVLKWDKFGGRIVGDVFLQSDDGEECRLSDYLLANGLAKPYDGKRKKEKWTEKELTVIIATCEENVSKRRR